MFTLDELSSIVDAATERADALRGYIDHQRMNGEAHWRTIAEKADAEHLRQVREGNATPPTPCPGCLAAFYPDQYGGSVIAARTARRRHVDRCPRVGF